MSFSFRRGRLTAPELHGVRQYLWYAIGEVILIFAGITLALGFGNWNEERKVRKLETKALADIAANLNANVSHLKGNIKTDTRQMSACERVLEALSQRTPWRDAIGQDLWECRWWSSPYFNTAAYSSLKARGTDLVSDPELRYAILNLFEMDYRWFENDIDKTFWNFQTAVMEPAFNRYVTYKAETAQYVPNDYTALLESNEFSNMLHMKIHYQRQNIVGGQEVLQETESVINLINAQLSR